MLLIVNISDCAVLADDHYEISQRSRPSYIHMDDEAAETELLRLQKKYPEHEFILFKAVARARKSRTDKNLFMIERMNVVDE